MGSNERVILIKGDNSKWYEQAIFIVKKNVPAGKLPMDYVQEAERIIYNYLSGRGACGDTKQVSQAKPAVRAKKKNGLDTAIHVIMLICCLTLAAYMLSSF